MNSGVEDELNRIADKISSLAEVHLDTRGPYLLSNLGFDLGEDAKILKDITKSNLGQFITERLGHKYAVVITGPHRTVQAIVRASEPLIDHEGISLPEKKTKAEPRYHYRFWAAFAVPMRASRRFINLENYTFKDQDEDLAEPEYVEIEADLVPPATADSRDKLINESIRLWLAKHDLPAERFHSNVRVEPKLQSVLGGSKSLLEMVIETLDHRQLANTTISLDVVATLLKRRT